MPARHSLLAVPILAALLAVPGAAGSCPLTEMQFNGEAPFTSTEAAFDTVASSTKALTFDIPAATLTIAHDGKFPTFVRVVDTFVLSGRPPGTPVLVVLELVADGEVSTIGCGGANCWGYLGVRIVGESGSGEDIVGRNVFSGSQAVHADVGVPLLLMTGQPTEIQLELNANAAAGFFVTGTATFRFTDLPAGTAISSCRGYVQVPTAADLATWGGIKARYR